jgi:hypothetical protein
MFRLRTSKKKIILGNNAISIKIDYNIFLKPYGLYQCNNSRCVK